ncbi:MAG TPA: hypothetical protein VNK96_04935 [Fimbriimonadales bacterium]|nr:hypothetical protein [Fimbriimonadales bacterium]
MKTPKDVDAYMMEHPKKTANMLENVRRVIKKATSKKQFKALVEERDKQNRRRW